ncbi:Iron-sulfur cluster repair protein YtfE [Rubripirellula lacrimiformis]|uniref:Iron-sulfur cluster repair protein YtfE n=1 Tax=Rubripirellula lacrimiformis TaxID=1930273 RepID=A0A517N4S7_9BACT|nr:DUF542 domain-containing protein [Rubripirellula lacrimiformis]QDT02135.1 Iron-sulfur cluster repair protein YtfE [Rubripirellula lacrimiformis]
MSELHSEDLSDQSPIGRWVAQHPETAQIFETLKIDYFGSGDEPLDVVCRRNGLDGLRVHSLLQRTIAHIDDGNMDDWLRAPLADLCDNIEQTHHAFLKNSLPTVTSLLAAVIERHGDDHPELLRVHEFFGTWRDETLEVMREEERSLFPAIRLMESQGKGGGRDWRGIAKLIRRIGFEHQDIGDALRKARDASGNYAEPPDASPAYRQLLGLLRRIEADVRHHVHKEEFILFPRVLKLARQDVG